MRRWTAGKREIPSGALKDGESLQDAGPVGAVRTTVSCTTQHSLCQRLYQDAMTFAAHLKAPKTPRAVLVEMPRDLDSLHGRAAFVAWRRGGRDQLRSGHGVP
jgi:hypothetical protein